MKRLTPAAVTLITFVVAGLLVTVYFAKLLRAEEAPARLVQPDQATPSEFREIPMALGALEPGTLVTPAHLGTGRVKANSIEPETLLTERGLVGRITKEKIEAGRPIRSGQLYQAGERPPLAVASGMRAVSLSFSHGAALVGGLLRPGQAVDVHLTPRLDDPSDSRFRGGLTMTLLAGVRVLAVDGPTAGGDSNTVTLELTPEQANKLILAREKGAIALSFNPDGPAAGQPEGTSQPRATMEEILDFKTSQPSVERRASDRPFTSQTYKGSARTMLEFESSVPVPVDK